MRLFFTSMDCKILCYLGISGNKTMGTIRIFMRGREDCNKRELELKLHSVHSLWVNMTSVMVTGIITRSHLGLFPLHSAVSKLKA